MIKICDVHKSYNKSTDVLKGVNLDINTGEVVGLIGLNGAGKTTLLKLLAFRLFSDKGSINYKKSPILEVKKQYLRDVSFLIEPVYFEHMTIGQNLEFFLKINDYHEFLADIDNTLDFVGILSSKDKKINKVSQGMRQRYALAMSLITQPEFLVLDEPFLGLDLNGIFDFISLIRSWNETHMRSVLVSSHQVTELSKLCHRFVYLYDGLIHDNPSTEMLKHGTELFVPKREV